MLKDQEADLDHRLARFTSIARRAAFDEYEEDEEDEELSDEDVDELKNIGIVSILEDAIEGDLVDYDTVSTIIRRRDMLSRLPAETREEISNILLREIHKLYPVAGELSRFLEGFANSKASVRNRIKKRVVASIGRGLAGWPPEFHIIWMLNLLASSEKWGPVPEVLRIFRDHPSDAVRRYAALTLTVLGGRAEAVALKETFQTASALTRIAILLASRRLGKDERKHWLRSLNLTDMFEKVL